ncbi:MAG TPA: type II toxin-antitoxin system VapC family toxin [Thermoanaerobaculia bacterium]
MKPTVYVETTIISYLVGWLNRGSVHVAANQELTREWWSTRRHNFELYASTAVADELSRGVAALATERLTYLNDVHLFEVTADVRKLAAELLTRTRIPRKAEIDAVHIAVAAVNGMDYLLTWNCTHMANAVILPTVYDVCRSNGYEPPFICTPHELTEA